MSMELDASVTTGATSDSEARPALAPSRRFFSLVDQLRGVAALLVVYVHLVPNFLDSMHRNWAPRVLIDRFLEQPLHGELNLGWPAVAIFFFISGFVVTHASRSETTAEFAVKRALRVYPPIFLATLVVAGLAWCGVLVTGVSSVPDPADVALAASLVDFVVPGGLVLVGVAWTLVIEVMFYLMLGALRPVLGRAPVMVPVALLAICLIVEIALPVRGAASPVVYLAYVPVLVMGQIIYLARSRMVRLSVGAFLLAAGWIVFIFGIERVEPEFAPPASSVFANLALVGSIFVIAVLAEGRVAALPILAAVARRSFSLYLLHVPVGFTILIALVFDAHWEYTPALAVALIATAAAAELSYRFVEVPSMKLARAISRRIRARRSAHPDEGTTLT